MFLFFVHAWTTRYASQDTCWSLEKRCQSCLTDLISRALCSRVALGGFRLALCALAFSPSPCFSRSRSILSHVVALSLSPPPWLFPSFSFPLAPRAWREVRKMQRSGGGCPKSGSPKMGCPGKWNHGRFNLQSNSGRWLHCRASSSLTEVQTRVHTWVCVSMTQHGGLFFL